MGHINKVLQVPQGNDFVIRQDDKSNIILYTVQNGRLNKYQSNNELGMWENIELTEQEFKLIDSGLLEVDGDYSEDIDVILMNKLDETRIVVMPDDRPPHSYNSPYRLYYAYDTKKLYMNMADSWHFIASLDHNLLDNNGKLSHTEIETILDRLSERLTNVEEGTSIENVATKNDLEELRELMAGNIAALKDYVDKTTTGTITPPTTGGLQVVDTLPQDAKNDYTAIVRNAGEPYMAAKIMDKWFGVSLQPFGPGGLPTVPSDYVNKVVINGAEGTEYSGASAYMVIGGGVRFKNHTYLTDFRPYIPYANVELEIYTAPAVHLSDQGLDITGVGVFKVFSKRIDVIGWYKVDYVFTVPPEYVVWIRIVGSTANMKSRYTPGTADVGADNIIARYNWSGIRLYTDNDTYPVRFSGSYKN